MKNLINEAEKTINKKEIRDGLKDLTEILPSIAEFTMETYKEYMAKGFSEKQAFQFATDYTLKILFQK